MSLAKRKLLDELAMLLQKNIIVKTTDGKLYEGPLLGYDPDTFSICLADARDNEGKIIHRVFLNGSFVAQISATERPFDLKSLASRIEKVFPNMVNLYEEAGMIVVMDRIRVNEKGIQEGSGPAAERVKKVYDEFIKEQKIQK
jgi:small nuclear ribonucleoprotein (snRNP)-like protein